MAKFTIQVLARITPEQDSRLGEVMAMEPPVQTRAEGVRRLIDSLEDEDVVTADAAEGKEGLVLLQPDDVAALLTALAARTQTYNELSKQVRYVGHFLNTLTKLGHQIAKYGKSGTIPTAAIEFVGRKLDLFLDHMTTIAEQDADVERVIRACRS